MQINKYVKSRKRASVATDHDYAMFQENSAFIHHSVVMSKQMDLSKHMDLRCFQDVGG